MGETFTIKVLNASIEAGPSDTGISVEIHPDASGNTCAWLTLDQADCLIDAIQQAKQAKKNRDAERAF